MNFRSTFLLVSVVALIACNKKQSVVRSFCLWKTQAVIDDNSDTLMKQLGLQHLYLRYFDVDWNPYQEEALPLATMSRFEMKSYDVKITPSIFIVNTVLLHCNKKQLDDLAANIFKRAEAITEALADQYSFHQSYLLPDSVNDDKPLRRPPDYKAKFRNNISEILIDCDWTEQSRDNYFYLLGQLKQKFSRFEISVTIRLWQYKYMTKAGVPPVDKGLLMCYNMSDVKNYNTGNSIADIREFEQYIVHNRYPLRLDIALPVFSWVSVFRGNQFKGLLNNKINYTDTLAFKQIAPGRYRLKEDILVYETYLRSGDEVKVEKVSDEAITQMIAILKKHIKISRFTKVTFFSFDNKYIKDYGTETITKYYSLF